MPAGRGQFRRLTRGRLRSAVAAGRFLPRRSPISSSLVSKLTSYFSPVSLVSSSRSFGSGKMFDIRIKKMFFTSRTVIRAVDRTTRGVLSRFGAFVRQRARTSIRHRRAVSLPGMPPSSHTGLLRRGIFFGYDTTAASVVIGPVPLRGRGRVLAPPALEYGGRSKIESRGFGPGVWVHIRKRPYMLPAMRAELPGLPNLWRNSVKV